MVEGGGGDEEVEVGEALAAPPQERPRLGEALHDRVVEAEQAIRAQEVAEVDEVGLGLTDVKARS